MTRRQTALLTGAAGVGIVADLLLHTGTASTAATAGLAAALAVAHRHPRVAWVLAACVLLAAAPAGTLGPSAFVFALAHAFCAGRWEARWWSVAAFAAIVGGIELGVLAAHDAAVPGFLVSGASWGTGRALGEREVVAAQLAERARELEEEREAHAALSVRYERARIASELHDIVAHAISVMVIQASAGQRLVGRDPEGATEAFGAIAGAARQAEADMGRLVALLGDDAAIGPGPDLALVEELTERAAGSGLDVTLRLEGEREGLPAELVQVTYRVVQEGLTNALRYAAGAAVSVRVRGGPDAVEVDVANGPAGRSAALAGGGTGNGLRGLRERVGGCGGLLDAGQTADGGWLLSARLPRRAALPSA